MGHYCDNRKALSSYIIVMTHVGFISCRLWDLLDVMVFEILMCLLGSLALAKHLSYIGLFSPQVSATDEDRGSFGTISYNLGSSSGNTLPTQFTINKETGQLCTSTALDRDEGLDKFDLTVTATDGVSNYRKSL